MGPLGVGTATDPSLLQTGQALNFPLGYVQGMRMPHHAYKPDWQRETEFWPSAAIAGYGDFATPQNYYMMADYSGPVNPFAPTPK